MVSASTKRKRRVRGNLVAAAVEDGRARSKAERRALGTTVTPAAPDAALFVEDRRGRTKSAVTEEFRLQATEQRRALKRAKRSAPKTRRSEAVLGVAEAAAVAGAMEMGKKKREVGKVEKDILAKRRFDKPRGHVGNMSEGMRLEKVHKDGREDVWMSEVSAQVRGEIGMNRRRLTEKMNAEQRTAASVIHPADGLSINPTHADHQDKLGEALAKVVGRDDGAMWTEKKMKFDERFLHESREGEVGDTGMKLDERDSDVEEEVSEDEAALVKGVPERKTRSQRHKESRKREMASNIKKKRVSARRREDMENIEKVAEEAARMADKLSGEEKRRRELENPAPEKGPEDPVVNRLAGQRVRSEAMVEPVTLSSELSESMRGVKMPVANPLLRDRFLSYERRGLIEPPKVLPKELWRMEQAKRQELLRDRRKRKGRGSRSNLTFWRNGKSVIK